MSSNQNVPSDVEKGPDNFGARAGPGKLTASDNSADPTLPIPNTSAKEDPAVVGWDLPYDAENPRQWIIGKKLYQIIVASLLSLATTFGVAVYSVGIDDVASSFHVSREAASVPLTLFILGQGLGPIMAAPISELYGRRIVYISTPFLGMLFTLGAGFSQNLGSLCILRFLAGAFGSPCLSVGSGTVVDLVDASNRSLFNAALMVAPFLGTALGPILGGYAVQSKGWRWTQWEMLFVALPIWIAALFMSETFEKVILEKKARKLGLPIPPSPIPAGFSARTRYYLQRTVFRPFMMLALEPIVLSFAFYVAFNFVVLFSFLDTFPIVFGGVYHFDLGQIGLSFFGIVVGVILEYLIYFTMDYYTNRRKIQARQAKGDTTPLTPEERLYPAMVGSCMIPIALFWFGWSSRQGIHFIVPEIAIVIFSCGNLLVFTACLLYLIDTYGPLLGASAAAANGFLRYSAGGASPLFTTQMYHHLGIGWASSLLAFVSLGLMPIPWVLYRFGPAIRGKSRYTP